MLTLLFNQLTPRAAVASVALAFAISSDASVLVQGDSANSLVFTDSSGAAVLVQAVDANALSFSCSADASVLIQTAAALPLGFNIISDATAVIAANAAPTLVLLTPSDASVAIQGDTGSLLPFFVSSADPVLATAGGAATHSFSFPRYHATRPTKKAKQKVAVDLVPITAEANLALSISVAASGTVQAAARSDNTLALRTTARGRLGPNPMEAILLLMAA